MPDSVNRPTWASRAGWIWLLGMMVLLGLCLAVTAARFVTDLRGGEDLDVLVRGVLLLVGLIVLCLSTVVVYGLIGTVVSCEQAVRGTAHRIDRVESVLESLYESNRRLVDVLEMSDGAKSVLFREREVEAFNEALHAELIRRDYDKAEALVDEIERCMGAGENVRRMRGEIAAARDSSVEEMVDQTLERISRLIEAHEFTRATRDARRLLSTMPGNPKVAALPVLLNEARNKHKRELLQQYDEATRKGDIDRSIQLLHELDKYLTPQEGAALAESARGVFRAKRRNYSVQFSIRVAEEAWTEAIAIGQRIIREYPNSRMAQEVRLKMDTLRALAAAKAEEARKQNT